MTIDDLPRIFDVPKGLSDGVGITAVPHLGVTSQVISTGFVVRSNEPPTATVEVGNPHPVTGAIFGSVTAVDQGNGATSYGPTLFTTAKGGLVSVGATSGHFTYTPSVQARQFARVSAEPSDQVDTFTVTVTDLYGRHVDVEVTVGILVAGVPPSGAATVSLPAESGVVTGWIEGAAWDGGKLTFSLQNSSNPADSTAESAYSEKGGLVRLDTVSGQFTFVPRISTAAIPGLDTDRFVVTAIDAHGGTADIVVRPLAHLRLQAETVGTAPDVQWGRLAIAAAANGPIGFSLGRPPKKGAARVDVDGSYVYTRTPGLGHGITADDSFTIIGTDDFGRSITVATVEVCPPLADMSPVTGRAQITESAVNTAGVQTTRGRIVAIAADGRPVRVDGGGLPGNTVISAKGSTVTVNEDGTFTYSTALNTTIGHAAAAATALAADKLDHFTVTAEDGTLVVVPIHLLPHNRLPVQSTVGGSGRLGLLKTASWTTTVADPDGDDITFTIVQANPRGTVSVHRTRTGAFQVDYTSTSGRCGRFHPSETFVVRYFDGHVCPDGSPSCVSVTYTF
ncbi:VCBS domain-containing protein [Arthrobacter sp. SLBN-53]|uniref:VCBS domain-containing protein n=1 Tax=Arthrobacter sp. SLBN-53 TaxID=2768412 RepID=UPI0011745F6C|nr:VCBS domain-containing protein [Arthrobacter sp. SLBN-53]TQK31922.1 VCBS repeat-containing protein [Arthrobacter sp. SLBN-53]